MATFVKDKAGAFKKTGDQSSLPSNKRSEARMKSYSSTTDARAWGNNISDNKQYIIDLMGAELPKQQQLGKYVPVDVLIKTLMGNKDADIKRLNVIIKELHAFIGELHLNFEEAKKYNKMKSSWGAGDASSGHRRSHVPLSESKYGRTSSEARVRPPVTIPENPRTSSESRIPTPRGESIPVSASAIGKGEHSQVHTPRPHSAGGTAVKPSAKTASESYNSALRSITGQHTVTPPESTKTLSSVHFLPLDIESSHKDVEVGRSLSLRESETQTVMKPKKMVDQHQQVEPESMMKVRSSMKSRIPVLGATGDMKMKLTQTPVVSTHDIQTVMDDASDEIRAVKRVCPDCERNRPVIDQFESVKKQLDDRNYELQAAELEINKMKRELMGKENIDDDIAVMAKEIANLRASGCTDELRIVSTELQLLKKYCQKLIRIKADNEQLKLENDSLRAESASLASYNSRRSVRVTIATNTSARRVDQIDSDLRNRLQEKVIALKEMTKQRDKLQSNVVKLEAKLKKYENLNNEINSFKERSKVLDAVLEEKLVLERRLQRMAQMESEMDSLKMRADKADELQRALENAQTKLLQLYDQRGSMFAPDNGVNITAVVEDLRYKAREADVLRVDRDKMRVRLEELQHVEHQYKILQGKCRMMEAVRNERDVYKLKTIELSNLKDDYTMLREKVDQAQALEEERDTLTRKVGDLESVIADQENEISRLVLHIDRLSKGQDKQQDRIKEILTKLRYEVESKNSIISQSESHLAEVQEHLKHTIDSLTRETSDLYHQVCKANETSAVLKVRLERLSSQLVEATIALEKEKKMCCRYKAENLDLARENQRLQEFADRMNDLTDAGKLESILRKSHAALQSAAKRLTGYDPTIHRSSTDSTTNTASRAFETISGASRRIQTSSLFTGIMNIPTHDYDQTSLPSMQGDGSDVHDTADRLSEPQSIIGSLHPSEGVQQADSSQSQMVRSIGDDDFICADSPEMVQRMIDLEERGEINLDNVTCVCGGKQDAVCICEEQVGVPPCRPVSRAGVKRQPQRSKDERVVTHGDSITCICEDAPYEDDSLIHKVLLREGGYICVENVKDQMRLQALENEGKLSLEDILCACKEQLGKVCTCVISGESSPPCRNLSQVRSPTTDSLPYKVLLHEGGQICVDNADDQNRLQALEDEGKLSLEDILCVCKGQRGRICVCLISGDLLPPCRKEFAQARSPSTDSFQHKVILHEGGQICVDNKEDQRRLQLLEDEGKLSLEDVICVCKGKRNKVCSCIISSRSSSSPASKEHSEAFSSGIDVPFKVSLHNGGEICVANIEDQRKLQALEDEGKLTLDDVLCMCKGKNEKACSCIISRKSSPTKGRKNASQTHLPVAESSFKVSLRSGGEIKVDNVEDQQKLQALEDKGKLSLDDILCVCKGQNNKTSSCTISALSSPSKRRTVSQTLPSIAEVALKVQLRSGGEICVDNYEDQRKLQALEDAGQLSLEDIVCVCRGERRAICTCSFPDASAARRGADKSVGRPSRQPSGHYSGKAPCRRGANFDVATICVDDAEELQRLQDLEDQGRLSLTKIQCVCRGTQVEVCECKDAVTDAPRRKSPCRRGLYVDSNTICVDTLEEQLHLQQLEAQDQLSLENITCVCKGVQCERCLCLSASTSPVPSMICVDDCGELRRLEELARKGQISLTNITCVCKGVQNEVCVCKSCAAGPAKPPHFAGPATTHTSGVYSDTDVLSISKVSDFDPCDELRAELMRSEKDYKELKKKFETLGMENQALRKHAGDLKEVARSQISELSNELRKSRETDDSKAVADLQEQNKLLQSELAMLKKLQCECAKKYQDKLNEASPELEMLRKLQCECSKMLKERAGKSLPELDTLRKLQCECSKLRKQAEELEMLRKKQCECSKTAKGVIPEEIKSIESEKISKQPSERSTRISLEHSLEQRIDKEEPSLVESINVSEHPSELASESSTPIIPVDTQRVSEHPSKIARRETPSLEQLSQVSQRSEAVKEIKEVQLLELSPTPEPELVKPMISEIKEVEKQQSLERSPTPKSTEQILQVQSKPESKQTSEQPLQLSQPAKKVSSHRASEHPSEIVRRGTSSPKQLSQLFQQPEPVKEIKEVQSLKLSPTAEPELVKPVISEIKEVAKPTIMEDIPKEESKHDAPPKKEPDDMFSKKLEDCSQELDDLRKQLENCRKDLDDQKRLNAAQKEPESVIKPLTPENDDLRKQLEDMKKQLEAAQSAPKEKEVSQPVVKDITPENDDLRKQLEALKQQLKDAKDELEKEKDTPKGDSPDLDDLKKQLEALKKQLQDANKRLEDCQNHLEEEKKKLEEERKKQPVPVDNKELDELRKQLADSKKQLEDERMKPLPSAATTPTIVGPSQRDYDDLLKKLADCQGELDKEKQKKPVDNQKELDDLRKQLAEAQKPIAPQDKQKELDDSKKKVTDVQKPETLPDKEKELDDSKKKVTDAQRPETLPDKEKELDATKKKVTDVQKPETLPDKEKELDASKKKITDVQKPETLPDKEKELDDSKKKVTDVQKPETLPDKEKELDALKKKGTDVQKPETQPDKKKEVEDSKKKITDAQKPEILPDKEKEPDYSKEKPAEARIAKEDSVRKPLTASTVAPAVQAPSSPLEKSAEESAKVAPIKHVVQPDNSTKLTEVQKPIALPDSQKQLEDPKKKLADVGKSIEPTKAAPTPAEIVQKSAASKIPKEQVPAKKIPTQIALEEPSVKPVQASSLRAPEKSPDEAAKTALTKQPTIDDYKKRLSESLQENADQKRLLKESSQKLNQLAKELEKAREQSIEAIKSARASFERDILNMQEKYIEGIESLQASHEELISQGNKELETEIESLRRESCEKQSVIDDLRCLCYDQKKKKSALCSVQLQVMDIKMECVCDDMQFAYLLRKVLYCGLESLTFEDLQYLHTKICDATAKVMGTVKRTNYDLVSCSCDYRMRQSQAQSQVAKLQMEVALERQRLENLKKALDIERSTHAAMAQHFQRQAKLFIPARAHHVQTVRTFISQPDSGLNESCRCASAVELNPKRQYMSAVQGGQSSTMLRH